MTVWLVDGNNVVGSRPDRWWNNRSAAQQRFAQQVAEWCRERADDDVVLVFDGRPVDEVTVVAGGNLTIEFAATTGRDAADHRIVELTADHPAATVVTADRGLVAQLPEGVTVVGPRRFLELVGGETPP